MSGKEIWVEYPALRLDRSGECTCRMCYLRWSVHREKLPTVKDLRHWLEDREEAGELVQQVYALVCKGEEVDPSTPLTKLEGETLECVLQNM